MAPGWQRSQSFAPPASPDRNVPQCLQGFAASRSPVDFESQQLVGLWHALGHQDLCNAQVDFDKIIDCNLLGSGSRSGLNWNQRRARSRSRRRRTQPAASQWRWNLMYMRSFDWPCGIDRRRGRGSDSGICARVSLVRCARLSILRSPQVRLPVPQSLPGRPPLPRRCGCSRLQDFAYVQLRPSPRAETAARALQISCRALIRPTRIESKMLCSMHP